MSSHHHEPEIWQRFQSELQRSADASVYDVWLSPLSFGGYDGRTLSVNAPAEHRAWIAARFMSLLRGAAEALDGCDVQLLDEGVTVPGAAGSQSGADNAPPEELPEPVLNPRMTFDQFVIGEANRFGHAAALAVAEAPGAAYNPLFIYGPPGVGKTHLLHAIGNYVEAFGGGLRVHFATAETFTNEFVTAVARKGDIDRFKGRYRSNDVLLIDDVQFLESKVSTEEEFFHTFNALQDCGAQIVLTSDRAPADLAGLQERLRARFAAGLLVDIEHPDNATRQLVLRKRIHHDGVEISDDAVIPFIADHVTQSVRALEGALIRVAAYGSLQGKAIDLPLARKVLDRLYPPGGKQVSSATIDSIKRHVSDEYDVTTEELVSSDRSARVAWPRQLAMYLCREHTAKTLPAIGKAFGGRDHTTVLYAHRKASSLLATDPELYDLVRRLTERVLSGDDDRAR